MLTDVDGDAVKLPDIGPVVEVLTDVDCDAVKGYVTEMLTNVDGDAVS